MYCFSCGKQVPDDADLCENCGSSLRDSGGKVNIALCKDGKYRWYYEFPMFKNPVILFTIWKVMLMASLVPALVVFFSELSGGFAAALKQFAAVYGIAAGATFLLSVVGYIILSALYGFKYIVLFEMDDEGITHCQANRQFKKAQAEGWLTAFIGAAAGNTAAAGVGILVSGRQKMTSDFDKVQQIICRDKFNTIKLNGKLSKNQIYLEPEDYEFVLEFITDRCSNASVTGHETKR